MPRLSWLLLLIIVTPCLAKSVDLGAVGKTYEIAEPDMLQSIYSRLKTAEEHGELARIEKEMKERFIAYANRPRGAALPRVQKARTHYFDPSIKFGQEITDYEGKVLWPAGTAVNPLEYISLTQQWVFFDGDDPAQVAWAFAYQQSNAGKNTGRLVLILTQGAVLELMKQWQRQIYFDQGGKLIERFGIDALPAVVRQEGKRLRIDLIEPGGGHG